MDEPIFAERFRCKHSDMHLDNWKYGSATQYVCERSDGSLQCARASTLPFTSLLIGAMLATGVCFAAYVGYHQPDEIIWTNVYIMAFIAGLFLSVPIGAWFGGFTYMVAVGPRQYDGKRVFWHEIDEAEYRKRLPNS